MAGKSETTIIIILVVTVLLLGIFLQKNYILFSILGSETMEREVPSIVNPGSTFTITYEAMGTEGTWGASIVDSVAGGCKFPDGTSELKTVMLSSDGVTKTLTMTAPISGDCTFTGDYKFGTSTTLSFPTETISICSATCTRPSNLCTEASSVSDGCGGDCTGSWTVTKNTNADTNCDEEVDRVELGNTISNWISGSITRDELGISIVAWIGEN